MIIGGNKGEISTLLHILPIVFGYAQGLFSYLLHQLFMPLWWLKTSAIIEKIFSQITGLRRLMRKTARIRVNKALRYSSRLPGVTNGLHWKWTSKHKTSNIFSIQSTIALWRRGRLDTKRYSCRSQVQREWDDCRVLRVMKKLKVFALEWERFEADFEVKLCKQRC